MLVTKINRADRNARVYWPDSYGENDTFAVVLHNALGIFVNEGV